MPVLVKEHGFGIEEAVSFTALSASRVYRDFHPLPVRESGCPFCDGIPIAEAVILEINPVRTEEVIPLREGFDWYANRLAALVHVKPWLCIDKKFLSRFRDTIKRQNTSLLRRIRYIEEHDGRNVAAKHDRPVILRTDN